MKKINRRYLKIIPFTPLYQIIRCLVFFLLLCSGVAHAKSEIAQSIHSILSNLPHTETRVGACVIDLSTGEMVYAHHADVALIPASTMKIFTMAAALEILGPDFAFETHLLTDGDHLYVIGDGDPSLGDEKLCDKRNEPADAMLHRWADLLILTGITVFPGQLIIDESIFDDQWVNETWEKNDLDKWYAAPIGGLNFNDNCVDITILPDAKSGAPVFVSVQPDTTLLQFVNRCKSGGKGKPVLHHPFDSILYKISGRCTKKWRFGAVSFPDPGMLFADSLRTVLAKRGVTFSGDIERRRVRAVDGSVPESLIPIISHRTSMGDVLSRTGKNSQNMFAECLLKRSGYAWSKRNDHPSPQGSWETGRLAVMDTMTEAGIGTEGFFVADGSGLSRENKCTARQMVSLLTFAHHNNWGKMFHDNLSMAGVDGSLKKRLTDHPGRVFAKTGTMRSVRALAGYVDQKDGQPRYAFAVVFNGYKGPSTPYKKIQDQICRILVQHTSE